MARYEVDGTSARKPDGEEGPFLRLVKNEVTPDISGRSSIKPNSPSKQNQKIINFDDARRRLANNELAASGEVEQDGTEGLGGVRNKETNIGGLYTGSGRKVNEKSRNSKKRYGKGWFKKVGPVGGILITILLFGGLAFGSLSMQIVAWKENISSMFGQSSAVISRRSNFMMKALLKTNRDTTSNSIFGKTKFKISSSLSKKLAKHGINYVETKDSDGKKMKLFIYEDPDGKVIPIVASDEDIGWANTLKGKEIDVGDRKIRVDSDAMELSQAKNKNRNFDIDFDTATITFTGKIAGWFDNMADSMFERIVGKNARRQTNIDDPDKEKVDEMLLKNKSQGVDDSDLLSMTKEDTEEDGKEVIRPAEASDEIANGKTYGDIESENDGIKVGDSDIPDVGSKLTAKAQKIAMASASAGCAFLRGFGAISATIGAVQTMNVISYASKILEIADKIKAGDADEVTNLSMQNINKSVKTTAYDMDGEEVVLEGSVASSPGFNAAFTSKNIINENDPGALYVNREYANKNALRNALGSGIISDVVGNVASSGAGINAFKICNSLQVIGGVIDFVSDVLSIFTFGIAKGVKEIISGTIKGISFNLAMGAISTVIALIAPTISTWFAGTLLSTLLGIIGGYSLFSGAKVIFDDNLQMSTGIFADAKKAIELNVLTQETEKRWGAYERATKSPFDIDSKYTFLGSIVNAMIPIANLASGSLVSAIVPMAELTKNSTLALVSPIANAASDVDDFAASLASEDNCPYLSSVGVAGDFACNKYSGAYVHELDVMDPDTIYNNMKSYGSFDGEDSNGNPKIKSDSDYAKFIVACVASDSQPGTMSGTVQGFISSVSDTGSVVGNALVNFGMNFIPGEGAIDFLQGVQEYDNMKWNSGLACTGNTDDANFNEKIKNFSMYNLDQRVLYDMGIIESNSTVSFLDEYYEENPLDNSFEGRIARFSGMTKEEVSDTLALIEYYDFIANYDPGERYVFGVPAVEMENELRFDNENSVAENVWGVLADAISYADVRNRSFAV